VPDTRMNPHRVFARPWNAEKTNRKQKQGGWVS
jgi:hypothetical protein